jgi:hypothetical protein
MWIDKAQTWEMAEELGGDALMEIIRRDSQATVSWTTARSMRRGMGVRVSGL